VRSLSLADEDSVVFENRFSTDKEVLIQTKAEMDANLAGGTDFQTFWAAYDEAYGEDSRHIAFTRVAFNEAGDKAVYAVSSRRGAASGFIVHAAKVNGVWELQWIAEVWVT
jgi:hypothetical protein